MGSSSDISGTGSPPTRADIERMAIEIARRVELAMFLCGPEHLDALDAFLEVRRRLSPMVDKRSDTPPAPGL